MHVNYIVIYVYIIASHIPPPLKLHNLTIYDIVAIRLQYHYFIIYYILHIKTNFYRQN